MITVFHGTPEVRFNEIVRSREITSDYGNRVLLTPSNEKGAYLRVHVDTGEDGHDKRKASAYLDALFEMCGNVEYTGKVYVLELLVPEDIIGEDANGATWLDVTSPLEYSHITAVHSTTVVPADLETAASYIRHNSSEADLFHIVEAMYTEDFRAPMSEEELGANLENLANIQMGYIPGSDVQSWLSVDPAFLRNEEGGSWRDHFEAHSKYTSDLLKSINDRQVPKPCADISKGEFIVRGLLGNTGIQFDISLHYWLDATSPFRIAQLLLKGPHSKFTNEVLREVGEYDCAAAGLVMMEHTLEQVQNLQEEDSHHLATFGFSIPDLEDFLQNEYESKWEQVCAAKEKLLNSRRMEIETLTQERAGK